MYRIFGILSFLFLLTSCDDGDMSVTTFNFQNQNVSKCTENTFIYKVDGSEVLILDIPLSNFRNMENRDENNEIIPLVYTLQSSDKLLYRRYNSNISSSDLCASIAPFNPSVQEEWTAIAGAIIEIRTYANHNSENGGILGITGYTHHITLKDVKFSKGNSQLIFDEYVFGNYTTPNLVKFNFTDNLLTCNTNNLLYKLNAKESIVLEAEQSLFENEPTEGTPRIAYINGTTNRVIYRVFDANITGNYFCSTIPQTSPNVVEEWYIADGVMDESGIIEVETEEVFDQVTSELIGYKHHITLKNVSFYNSNSNFFLEEYYLGSFGVEL